MSEIEINSLLETLCKKHGEWSDRPDDNLQPGEKMGKWIARIQFLNCTYDILVMIVGLSSTSYGVYVDDIPVYYFNVNTKTINKSGVWLEIINRIVL